MKEKILQYKFSVIIPTLQRGNHKILNHLLDVLNSDSSVGEVILIDNSLKGYDSDKFPKVRVILPEKNLYVNSSWNLGIMSAKYDYFAILNDDLIIPNNLCQKIMEKFKKECLGLVGLSNAINNLNLLPPNLELENLAIETLRFEILQKRQDVTYWGSAIFGRKQDYYKIPDNIKIWCGDDYLFFVNKKNGKNCYQLITDRIYHIHSSTSRSNNWKKIKKEDMYNYKKIDKDFKIPDGYTRRNIFKYLYFLFSGVIR